MKKIITNYLNSILSDFKWYRKRKGGKWYKVYDSDGMGGFGGPIVYWTQAEDDTEKVTETENYT